jgi:hypothetical protein
VPVVKVVHGYLHLGAGIAMDKNQNATTAQFFYDTRITGNNLQHIGLKWVFVSTKRLFLDGHLS